jgi:hypothetical protein
MKKAAVDAATAMHVSRGRRKDEPVELEADDLPARTLIVQGVQELHGVTTGLLVGVDNSGTPLVDFAANDAGRCLTARSTVVVNSRDIGRDIALMFEGGDARKPIVMGLIQRQERCQPDVPTVHSSTPPRSIPLEVDGDRLILTAQREIVLRCGNASITLTQAGKILIRGAYLLSASSGANRIKGASVQIN